MAVTKTGLYLELANKVADIIQKRCHQLAPDMVDDIAADIADFIMNRAEVKRIRKHVTKNC